MAAGRSLICPNGRAVAAGGALPRAMDPVRPTTPWPDDLRRLAASLQRAVRDPSGPERTGRSGRAPGGAERGWGTHGTGSTWPARPAVGPRSVVPATAGLPTGERRDSPVGWALDAVWPAGPNPPRPASRRQRAMLAEAVRNRMAAASGPAPSGPAGGARGITDRTGAGPAAVGTVVPRPAPARGGRRYAPTWPSAADLLDGGSPTVGGRQVRRARPVRGDRGAGAPT